MINPVKAPNKKLLVIGELNMDLILDRLNSMPELGKEKIANELSLTLGSSSAIFASNISRLGTHTKFCGMVGSDYFGSYIINKLQDFKINTTSVIRSSNYKTGLTVFFRYNNDRSAVTYPGAMKYFSFTDIPDKIFKNIDHVHISSIFLQPAIKKDLYKIIRVAKSNSATISVDPQWDPDEEWDLDLKELVPKIDFFLPNKVEFLNLTQSSSIKSGLQKFRNIIQDSVIVVKNGEKGATYLTRETLATVSTYINDNVVDTVGAGDSFNAGLIFRFLKGDSIKKSIKFANISGAVSTTKAGGTSAIQSLDELIKIAKDNLSISDINEFTR